ncbi:MAG: hypothetical protein ACRC9P_06710 [Bacteroides sp.]
MESNLLKNILLLIVGVGVWTLVIQNSSDLTKAVRVVNTVGVYGTVDIDDRVEVDIQAINGKSNVFYQDTDGDYMVLPVTIR